MDQDGNKTQHALKSGRIINLLIVATIIILYNEEEEQAPA